MKYVISFLKKIVLSFIILYGYNMIATNFNLVLPINIFTVTFVALLGFPALFSLVILFILVF